MVQFTDFVKFVKVEVRAAFMCCSVKFVARKTVCHSISVEFAVQSSRRCTDVTDTCAHTAVLMQHVTLFCADCAVNTVTRRATWTLTFTHILSSTSAASVLHSFQVL